jgi:hypothetical protein
MPAFYPNPKTDFRAEWETTRPTEARRPHP